MSLSYITDSTPAGDFETKTISSAAVALATAKLRTNQEGGFYKDAVKLFITVETNSIRLRWDGTNPTTSVGHLLTAGSSITLIGEQNISKLRMIAAAADGVVMVTYYYNR